VPPVVAAPCFAIRRPAVAVYTLGDYVDAGIMSAVQAGLLRAAVRDRKNVLVAGGTSSGSSRATLPSGARNGFGEPRDREAKSSYRDIDRRQRPNVPHLNPRKCPQSAHYSSENGKNRLSSDCVVVGLGGLEPPTSRHEPAWDIVK
jgi:hypothetical protein